MADRVRIVARGPLGAGTEVHLLDERGNPREFDMPVRAITIDPITPDGTLVARLEVPVDELDVQAELAPAAHEEAQVRKLRLEPGDSIVLHYKGLVSPQLGARLREQLSSLFPGHRIIVLDSGMELGLVRESRAAQEAQGLTAPSIPAAQEGGHGA